MHGQAAAPGPAAGEPAAAAGGLGKRSAPDEDPMGRMADIQREMEGLAATADGPINDPATVAARTRVLVLVHEMVALHDALGLGLDISPALLAAAMAGAHTRTRPQQ